jgi:hypothetical protein
MALARSFVPNPRSSGGWWLGPGSFVLCSDPSEGAEHAFLAHSSEGVGGGGGWWRARTRLLLWSLPKERSTPFTRFVGGLKPSLARPLAAGGSDQSRSSARSDPSTPSLATSPLASRVPSNLTSHALSSTPLARFTRSVVWRRLVARSDLNPPLWSLATRFSYRSLRRSRHARLVYPPRSFRRSGSRRPSTRILGVVGKSIKESLY